jgi:hypothetical protein
MSKTTREIRKIPISLPWYWQKSFDIYLCIKRRIHKNHQPKVERIKEELWTTLENKKKVITNSPISDFKRKNKIKERRASCLGVKKEQKSTNVKA